MYELFRGKSYRKKIEDKNLKKKRKKKETSLLRSEKS